MNERLLQEPDFRLCRMHVDVHAIRRDANEEVDLGTAFLDRRDAVRLRNRVRDRPIFDDPAVYENVLRAPDRPLIAERRDVAVDLEASSVLAQLDQIEPFPEELKEALARPARRRTLDQLPPLA